MLMLVEDGRTLGVPAVARPSRATVVRDVEERRNVPAKAGMKFLVSINGIA
jgi:hypothetical protein